MSDKVSEVIGQMVVQIVMTLLNAVLIMWFWNDGLVGAVDGVHAVGYPQAVLIYMLVGTFFEPLFKMSRGEK
jgi:hypothetical protein